MLTALINTLCRCFCYRW